MQYRGLPRRIVMRRYPFLTLAVLGLAACSPLQQPDPEAVAVTAGTITPYAGEPAPLEPPPPPPEPKPPATAAKQDLFAALMDSVDRLRVQQILETSPTGQATTWRNPDNRNRYTVTPVRTRYRREDGTPCRQFTAVAVIEGKQQTHTVIACRNPDGEWRIRPLTWK